MARRRNGRIRRSVRGTAVTAAAVAALTASQPPVPAAHPSPAAGRAAAPKASVSGDGPYLTELPPLRTPGPSAGTGSPAPSPLLPAARRGGIPVTALEAYRRADAALALSHPRCRLSWQLLAAIGQVESGHARGGRVTADGTAAPPILGPRLDGAGFARITDTDGGAYDGDTVYDRAVGPMQFIPSTWAAWGADGNGDGREDPNNIHDAALAAGRYLCAGGRNLSDPADLNRAILGYNRSEAYLRTVLAWFAYFRGGHFAIPDSPAGQAAPESARPKPSRTASGEPERAGGEGGARPSSAPAPTPEAEPSKPPRKRETAEPEPETSAPDRLDVPDRIGGLLPGPTATPPAGDGDPASGDAPVLRLP
ncbi:lytic transglycosylase domain-containing protein [Streptomyces radiopugnans]|uniref:Membrane-bound lytic murein transglycosylase B n=1 Tax=Streptomyces radiopugnans TaxID=403935 RepID=A0A1H8ZG53_9ACTN|nr:lytic transglycosylase domain-containing protein [Streptomyces radiopugnans]SEP63469.1 Membrane-bound lytic murein transglycosylase B [Streptomyces radiopugnans]